MPGPTLVVVLAALFVGNLILAVGLVRRRRMRPASHDTQVPVAGEPVDLAIELGRGPDSLPASGSGIRLDTYDRVVRVVSYTFLLVTAVVVAVGGLWPTNALAIYLLLLAGAAAVFVLHDRAPRIADLGTMFLVEGAVAVTFITLLIVLTDGVSSPYFFGYFLIVAAAALVTGGGASLVLTAVITAAYLGAMLATRGGQPYAIDQVVIMAVDILALWLLSYLASVVAGEQRRTRDAALRLSLHDPLTRLYNRTFLFAVIEREIARAGRTNRRFSLLMLDLDGLKPINDRFGHFFGDRMLQAVAGAVRQGIRVIDTAARYGGDEFVVLLPETDAQGAAVVAEKLRRSVAAIRLSAGTELLSSTASIGVVAFPDDGRTADALTNRADQVMYGAKRAGRNRVSIEGHGPLPVWPGPAGAAPVRISTSRDQPRRSTRPARATIQRPARQARPKEARPSMFSEAYPPLPQWARQRFAPWAVGPGPSGSPPTTNRPPSTQVGGSNRDAPASSNAATSPLASTRTPTARVRRFRVEHPEDRTFERAMRVFLAGDGTPAPGGTEQDERRT